MKPEIIGAIVTVGCALLAAWMTHREQKNRRLKRKYRQALRDLRGFYELEMQYCAWIVRRSEEEHTTEMAVKRLFRSFVRASGMETPSGEATPQRIAEELAKL